MAALRAAAPSISSIYRFIAQPPATRRCAQCLKAQRCPFSSSKPRATSSKRPLMTESAHRPQAVEPEMPPPRDSGTSDTSIGGAQRHTWPPSVPWQVKDSNLHVALNESEAQDSKALNESEAQNSKALNKSEAQDSESLNESEAQNSRALNESEARNSQALNESEARNSKALAASISRSATAQPSTIPELAAKPRKSKLRPAKAPITLTPKAIEQLQELFEQPESKLIRIGVKNRGCSGLAYHLEYVDKPGAFDEAVEQDGVKVLIDSKALFSIIGSEMDWVEDKLSARFIFKNPNITEQCGCGESFSIS